MVMLSRKAVSRRQAAGLGLVVVALLGALAVPALAAKPSSPPGQANKPGKVAKQPITISGTIQESSDADGHAAFSLQDGGTTYTLDGGPWWFYGDDHPLKGYVGQSVTVVGEVADGSTEVDVESVNGTPLRAAGKPPWAGGWKVVGERHPGWSQEKADRFADKFGGCWPPGHCKPYAAPEE
jgi:hypothetical protein